MSNPKLEVFKLTLQSEKSPSFQRLFSPTLHEDDSIVFLDSFKKFIEEIDKEKYHTDSKKGKGFTTYYNKDKNIITPHSNHLVIEGLLEGGKYGRERTMAPIDNKNEKSDINKNNIINDKFYFFIHTPLDSKYGVVMIQNFGTDTVSDLFMKFLEKLYSNELRGYKRAKSERFIPKYIIEDFRENSELKTFKFTSDFVIDEHSSAPISQRKEIFKIKIIAESKSGIIKDKLDAVLNLLKSGSIAIGKNNKKLESFSSNVVTIRDKRNGREKPFKLSNRFEIQPAIFLNDIDGLTDGNTIRYEKLRDYCINLLSKIKPEIYPIKMINEK